jgi:phosphatidylserine/phosphatidylglycerophosphate/cardiolipin synthase-like enzyme
MASLISAIRLAKREIHIVIFRCDSADLTQALEAAVKRGVKVQTLIAHTNRGGEKSLRKLEQKMLDAGALVARTGDEFVRYHCKMVIIDRQSLWVLGFNFTALDTTRSRSFGIVTRQKTDVLQALRLFEADATKQPFEPSGHNFVVSPENARENLSRFIGQAKKQLLIYDPKVSDPAIIKLLKERVKAGVDVRIIGKVAGDSKDLRSEKYPGKRLHVRAIVRDMREAFVGSQSLRKIELDKRREVGLIVKSPPVVAEMIRTFEEDWAQTDSGKRDQKQVEKEKDKGDDSARKEAARATA